MFFENELRPKDTHDAFNAVFKQYAINADMTTKPKHLCRQRSVGVLVMLHVCENMWSSSSIAGT